MDSMAQAVPAVEMAARHVLADNRPVTAKDTTGIVEAVASCVAREGAVKARSAALNSLIGLIVNPRSREHHRAHRGRLVAIALHR